MGEDFTELKAYRLEQYDYKGSLIATHYILDRFCGPNCCGHRIAQAQSFEEFLEAYRAQNLFPPKDVFKKPFRISNDDAPMITVGLSAVQIDKPLSDEEFNIFFKEVMASLNSK